MSSSLFYGKLFFNKWFFFFSSSSIAVSHSMFSLFFLLNFLSTVSPHDSFNLVFQYLSKLRRFGLIYTSQIWAWAISATLFSPDTILSPHPGINAWFTFIISASLPLDLFIIFFSIIKWVLIFLGLSLNHLRHQTVPVPLIAVVVNWEFLLVLLQQIGDNLAFS